MLHTTHYTKHSVIVGLKGGRFKGEVQLNSGKEGRGGEGERGRDPDLKHDTDLPYIAL